MRRFFSNRWVLLAVALFLVVAATFLFFRKTSDGVVLANQREATLFIVLEKKDSADMETAFIRAGWGRVDGRAKKVVATAPPAYRVERSAVDSPCRGGYVLERLPGEKAVRSEMSSGCFFSSEDVVWAVQEFEGE